MTTPVAARTIAPATTRERRGRALAAAGALAFVAVVASVAIGSRGIPPGDVLAALLDPDPDNPAHTVVRDLRVPRTVIGLLAGAALGMAGVLMQGVTRNPLADPGLLGVNAGASLAVVVAITWLGMRTPGDVIWFALAGAFAAMVLVYGVAGRGTAQSGPVALALAGTAITAALTSIVTVVLLSDPDTLNQYRFWSVGSLVGRDLAAVTALWPFLAAGAVLAAATARSLDVLALGEDLATGLGERVRLTRASVVAAVVLLAGTATALAGPIVLVGLLVAHVARGFLGHAHGWVLAASALLGAALLVTADVIGRLVVRPAELEAGIVVAFVGAPVLIAMVRRDRLPGV